MTLKWEDKQMKGMNSLICRKIWRLWKDNESHHDKRRPWSFLQAKVRKENNKIIFLLFQKNSKRNWQLVKNFALKNFNLVDHLNSYRLFLILGLNSCNNLSNLWIRKTCIAPYFENLFCSVHLGLATLRTWCSQEKTSPRSLLGRCHAGGRTRTVRESFVRPSWEGQILRLLLRQ